MRLKTVDAATGRWRGVLMALGIGEEFLGTRHGPCPVCGGKDRFRFDDKEGRGTYYCNGCGPGGGIDLVMKCKNIDYKGACKMVDRVVGTAPQQEEKKKPDNSVRLKRIHSELVPLGSAVFDYLAGRKLETPQGGVKQHNGLEYYDDGKASGQFPAMCALFVGADGKPATYHVTWLQGGQKAPVSQPKKILPVAHPMPGGAVRLYAPGTTLAIAEGIETAIAFKMLSGIPTWAATSAVLLEKFQPPEGVTTVIVAGDYDANFVGQSAAYGLAKRLHSEGYTVQVKIPDAGDWADVLMDAK